MGLTKWVLSIAVLLSSAAQARVEDFGRVVTQPVVRLPASTAPSTARPSHLKYFGYWGVGFMGGIPIAERTLAHRETAPYSNVLWLTYGQEQMRPLLEDARAKNMKVVLAVHNVFFNLSGHGSALFRRDHAATWASAVNFIRG